MTTKITDLQEHLKANHKDFDAKRSLLRLVAKRRTFLRYLKDNSLETYLTVSKNRIESIIFRSIFLGDCA